MDEQIISQRRKRSRSVGSVDSDAPDEYYVDLSELEGVNALEDKSWSKKELSKIAEISTHMLSDEQEVNIKQSFQHIFPTKSELEIKKLCDTMKINIVKELIKQEKAKMHALKKAKQAALSDICGTSASSSSSCNHNQVSSSSVTSEPTTVGEVVASEEQSPLKNRAPFVCDDKVVVPIVPFSRIEEEDK